ncbi:MAG: hypothetical protein ABF608_07125 [Sporolactobacillus sp.]
MTVQELYESISETLTNNPELAERHVYLRPESDEDALLSIADLDIDGDGDCIIVGEG